MNCSFADGFSRLTAIASLAGMLLAMPAMAQPAPSVVPPGGPTNPTGSQFDTTTPQHDPVDAADKAAKTVVAEIDGRAITLAQVGDAIKDLPPSERQRPFEELYPIILERLIVQQALVLRAHASGLDEVPAVKRQIQTESDRILSEEYASRATAAKISEETLQNKYRDEVAGKPGPEEVRFQTILVENESDALALIKKIQNGADFATVAPQSPGDPNAAIYGEVPFMARNRLTPEIGAVAFALSPGQMAPYPVRSAGAWYVIKVEGRRLGPPLSYEAARPRLLLEVQQQELAAIAKEALAHSTVRQYPITGKETSGKP